MVKYNIPGLQVDTCKCMTNYGPNTLGCEEQCAGFVCTLPKGHEMPHMACGCDAHAFAVWGDGEGDTSTEEGKKRFAELQETLAEQERATVIASLSTKKNNDANTPCKFSEDEAEALRATLESYTGV